MIFNWLRMSKLPYLTKSNQSMIRYDAGYTSRSWLGQRPLRVPQTPVTPPSCTAAGGSRDAGECSKDGDSTVAILPTLLCIPIKQGNTYVLNGTRHLTSMG